MQYFNLLMTAGAIWQLYVGCKFKSRIRQTSLMGAWWFWLLAWLLSSVVWICTQAFPLVNAGIADQLWYGTIVMTAAVPIAVLGARKPGHGSWLIFVLLPLILVLCWPVWLDAPRSWQGKRLSLEEPTLLGLALVVSMGFGNYLGTRWRVPVLLILSGMACVVWPFTRWGENFQQHSEALRTTAMCANTLAAMIGWGLAARCEANRGLPNHLATIDLSPYNRLWFEFRDLFGLVWAKRFQDRINQIAQREKWPVRLEWNGWGLETNHPGAAETSSVIEHMDRQHRWLLSRFVQPEWIDRHLAGTSRDH